MMFRARLLLAFVVGVVAQSNSNSVGSGVSSPAASSHSTHTTTGRLNTTKTQDIPSSITVLIATPTNIDYGTIFGNVQQTSFLASIVDADACKTTYALRQDPGDVMITVVEGPSHFYCDISTSEAGAEVSLAVSCDLSGSTQAVCRPTASVSYNGKEKKTTGGEDTLTGDQLASQYGTFSLTAGGDKLAKVTGSCSAPWTGTSAGIATPTGLSGTEVYKIIVVPAAAAMAAAMI